MTVKSFSVHQLICRRYFEHFTGHSFPSRSPKWLKRLILDGYCKELSVAFEYNGIQHYKEIGFFHSSPVYDFESQKRRDEQKRLLCESNGVKLIIVPYTVRDESIGQYIYDSLKYVGVIVGTDYIPSLLDLNVTEQDFLYEIKEIAIERGGECLSNEYVTSQTKMQFRCFVGHVWYAIPASIKRGTWCGICAGIQRLTIDHAQKLAKSKNGKCLSIEYENAKSLLLWECEFGHRWRAHYSNVKTGTWCPTCNGSSVITISDVHLLALKRNGRCITSEYTNSKTKMEFECAKFHRWFASYEDIRVGHWCPKCSIVSRSNKRRTWSIERIRKEIIVPREGEILSTEYHNYISPLVWRCKFGHVWNAPLDRIAGGGWCPFCSGHRPPSIGEIQKRCEDNGIRCLSNEYVDSTSLMKFECALGHVWSAPWKRVSKQNGHCPVCVPNILTIDIVRKDAEKIGYRCLSDDYKGSGVKLLYECNRGHVVWIRPGSVRHGTRCSICSGNSKFSIDDVKYFLFQSNGVCMSDSYKNANKKLSLKCELKHSFESRFGKIRSGEWCPDCYRTRISGKK